MTPRNMIDAIVDDVCTLFKAELPSIYLLAGDTEDNISARFEAILERVAQLDDPEQLADVTTALIHYRWEELSGTFVFDRLNISAYHRESGHTIVQDFVHDVLIHLIGEVDGMRELLVGYYTEVP